MEQYSFYAVIILISLVFAAATILLGGKRIHKRILKYIPSIIAAAATLALIIKTVSFSEGFEGLGYLILAMIAAVIFLVSIITAIIMEIINRKRNKQRNSEQNQ